MPEYEFSCGLMYYDHGIASQILLLDNLPRLFVGFDKWIINIDYINKVEIYKQKSISLSDNIFGFELKAIGKGGKVVVKYGDDALKALKHYGDDAAKYLGKKVKSLGNVLFKYGDDAVKYGDDVAKGVGSASKVPNKVTDLAKDMKDWLGKDARVITNKNGDKVFMSGDGIKRIRFDINNTSPHNNPHGHVEERVNGKWVKSDPIYPTDIPHS